MNSNLLRGSASRLCRNRSIFKSYLITISRGQNFCDVKSKFPRVQNGDNDQLNPIQKTFNIIKDDFKRITAALKSFNLFKSPNTMEASKNQSSTAPFSLSNGSAYEIDSYNPRYPDEPLFQTHCDVVIIGGGGVGASVAYWLKQKARDGLNVVVVERDPTYRRASTVLSVGGLRQQFSLPENIEMSLFGAEFIRTVKEHLGDDVELHFTPHGYLVLASESGAETLTRNSRLQNELGARNELLTASQLKAKFPWINTDGIALGCHGLEREGWFDPWALLMGFKNKARMLGAHFVNGEVVGFEFRKNRDLMVEGVTNEGVNYELLDKVIIQMPDGERRTIKFALCVLAAGAFSGEVAQMAKIGTTRPGLFRMPLPVEPRKRYVYVINTQGKNAPNLCTPLTIDPNGTYFRRDGLGGNYLCGRSPCSSEQEPSVDDLEVDHAYFESDVWPTLALRCPAFESAKVINSWAGYYEYNVFDENGIIGYYPGYHNLLLATGFSGHGIQQTPAIGRAISELIIDGRYRTINLSRLCFDRILLDKPMLESNII